MTRYSCVVRFVAIVAVSLAPHRAFSQVPSPSLLQLESKIPLGDVKGRIDHLAIDLSRQRLFVAELGNNTVGVADLNEQKVQHVITGLKEPQGVGYVPSSDTLFVANAGDGSVLLFRGADYAPAGRVELGDDADNIRVDTASNRVFVGHGSGDGNRPGDQRQDRRGSIAGSSRKFSARALSSTHLRERPQGKRDRGSRPFRRRANNELGDRE